jgi:hypothetical protein
MPQTGQPPVTAASVLRPSETTNVRVHALQART